MSFGLIVLPTLYRCAEYLIEVRLSLCVFTSDNSYEPIRSQLPPPSHPAAD